MLKSVQKNSFTACITLPTVFYALCNYVGCTYHCIVGSCKSRRACQLRIINKNDDDDDDDDEQFNVNSQCDISRHGKLSVKERSLHQCKLNQSLVLL